jgi:acyl-CoA thioesterase
LTSEVVSRIRALAQRDPFMNAAGFTLDDCAPGYAVVKLIVQSHHLNFNGTCHGGVVFALADTAFGLASNSHGIVAAGINAHITYSSPTREGDVLTATAREVTRTKRLATYYVEVARTDSEIAASFTGTVFILGKPHSP